MDLPDDKAVICLLGKHKFPETQSIKECSTNKDLYKEKKKVKGSILVIGHQPSKVKFLSSILFLLGDVRKLEIENRN